VFLHRLHHKQLYDANRLDQDLHLQTKGALLIQNPLLYHLSHLFLGHRLLDSPRNLFVNLSSSRELYQTYHYLLIMQLKNFELFRTNKIHFQ
jgi:hypothetical protein